MVKYIIKRPVAVFLSFGAILFIGLLTLTQIPVSLLPNVDVPQIIVRINYPNNPAPVIEQSAVKIIRESMSHLNKLANIESLSANHAGLIYLDFDYNTKMDQAFIEVNEKLDKLGSILPKELPRPQVVRINTSDIPIIRLQVIPKNQNNYLRISELAVKVLKRRLEQIDGVSLVDVNGWQQSVISVTPNRALMHSLSISDDLITQTIKNANSNLGGLSIKQGQYRYFLKITNVLNSVEAIGQLPLRLSNGSVILLSKVADIREEPEKPTGYHLFNGQESIVITVQKQADSRMTDLVKNIQQAVYFFSNDYPQADFKLTQDQSFLLDAGISNLYQDIIYGGILTMLLLFLFLGNWGAPILMSVSIPLSLIMTFVAFYLFNISFNIISLSGLALGIGMLIDNSIVVIDNIAKKRRSGLPLVDSCVDGTNEVITPVISQVLTTVAVYLPLIFLSGIGSSLITDQSIALTISLAVSLLVAFILTPLLYHTFLTAVPEKVKDDTRFYKWVAHGYHRMIDCILKHKLFFFLFTLLLMPIGIWLIAIVPVSSLPAIEKKESLLIVDWNDPIDAQENLRRVKFLQKSIAANVTLSEADVSINQFLLQQSNSSVQKAEMYYACSSELLKLKVDNQLLQSISNQYPQAILKIVDAPNAFTQLFNSDKPYFEARFRPQNQDGNLSSEKLQPLLTQLSSRNFTPGAGLLTEPNMVINLDYQQMALYGVTKANIEQVLLEQFGRFSFSEIERFGTLTTIEYKTQEHGLASKLDVTVTGNNGVVYPLANFIKLTNNTQPKFITANGAGAYKSILFNQQGLNFNVLQKHIRNIASSHNFQVDFAGTYFDNQTHLKELWLIFFVVLFLLYFILAIQYEDLLMPLIVMLTIPLGVTGGMLCLWLSGGTLNIMSLIGFIVILGLIVDDPILKVETLKNLENKYKKDGLTFDDETLKKMIHEAGDRCLKPLLMVSLTTSIALVPVLFVGGIGNDLQKPLSVVIIGGLTIGTFFTTWFIPLAFWFISKWRLKTKSIAT